MIVTNQSNVKYDYVLPDQSTQSGEQSSNIVNTEILTSAVTKVKSSDHTFLSEGETAAANGGRHQQFHRHLAKRFL